MDAIKADGVDIERNPVQHYTINSVTGDILVAKYLNWEGVGSNGNTASKLGHWN